MSTFYKYLITKYTLKFMCNSKLNIPFEIQNRNTIVFLSFINYNVVVFPSNPSNISKYWCSISIYPDSINKYFPVFDRFSCNYEIYENSVNVLPSTYGTFKPFFQPSINRLLQCSESHPTSWAESQDHKCLHFQLWRQKVVYPSKFPSSGLCKTS